MKKILLTGLVVLGLFTSAYAEDGAALYKKCASCHGQTGEKAALGASKIIKDMSHADFVTALNGYKDGSYGGAKKGIMKGQVTSLDAAQIEALATHIVK
ncbi:MAG: c-type cytochrome [Sulfurimonas sp.]|nr:c-type cytochrome [Sulfurimonas sp.]